MRVICVVVGESASTDQPWMTVCDLITFGAGAGIQGKSSLSSVEKEKMWTEVEDL